MGLIKYISRILGISKRFDFNRLERRTLEPAKLFGGKFTGTKYPEAFKTENKEGTIIISNHEKYFQLMELLERLSLESYQLKN